jgi:GNAT superfamily N-acetyltransferase
MPSIDVVDYRPEFDLDNDLAELGYAALHGWPDQRPVTAALVRSLLRALGTTASTLALHRNTDGRLLAAAAIRWPASLEGIGRLWGPLVHPAARGGGLGAALLETVGHLIAARPGVRVQSAEIPAQRIGGWTLFERAGWQPAGSSTLWRLPLPSRGRGPTIVVVRPVRAGEYPDQHLAALFAAARPELGYGMARDTYTRWSADERYTSEGLLLAETAEGLLGAVLVYPLTQPGGPEPAEALLADVLVHTRLEGGAAAAVRAALVDGAIRVSETAGATVVRAIVEDPDLMATLKDAGFQLVDEIRYYSPPIRSAQASAADAWTSRVA